MEKTDTVKLLQECVAGTKMAVSSMEEVLAHVKETALKEMIADSVREHGAVEKEIHALLERHKEEDKEPNPIAKGMSWMKTNTKLQMNESDGAVADIIVDGCNMGVKSLHKYLNQYKAADETAKGICTRLIELEEKLRADICCYL